MAVPSEAPLMEMDEELEAAVNEVTRQEMKVNALAILKKVAMTPSTVMGYAYLQSMKNDEGVPYFEGEIGDFLNYCVKYTLKFGFGVEFAIATGRPTLSDVIKQGENN